ncbi:MAG: hypothetical protein MK193_03285 [Lentisphaeria bacterium]|nr:hypothetical protein [Lentisphaeria bacterium]
MSKNQRNLITKYPFNRQFFSMADLIVILTFLTIIAAFIIPTVIKYQENAKDTQCKANLKSMHSWLITYSQGNDGHFMAFEEGWTTLLSVYSGAAVNRSIAPQGKFSCPSQGKIARLPDFVTSQNQLFNGSHYGINQHLASGYLDENNLPSAFWSKAKLNDFRNPQLKAFFGDASGGNYFKNTQQDTTIAGISEDGFDFSDAWNAEPVVPFPSFRHKNQYANFAMGDGSVRSKNYFPRLMLGKNSRGYKFWHGEHAYLGSGDLPKENPKPKPSNESPNEN